MSLSRYEERLAFSLWLRTGRRVIVRSIGPVETKYNHWHDPRDGRFTYAETGRHDGSWGGGGGGDFGGGGATGTLGRSPPQRRVRKPASDPKSKFPKTPMSVGGAIAIARRQASVDASKIAPLRRIRANGYDFYVDDAKRTKDVQGTLDSGDPRSRSRKEQRQAGKPDRRATDDGGHFIAARFNGPAEAFNHFAQDANFNRGVYRKLEGRWNEARKAGKKVDVRIMAFYEGPSKRPSQIVVTFGIDGRFDRIGFPNERQEKPNGKR